MQQNISGWQKFKRIKRAHYSLNILATLILISLAAEFLVNSKALIVSYQGDLYFPVLSAQHPGHTFGLNYEYETNYRQLETAFLSQPDNWLLMPLVPFNPTENDFDTGTYPPAPPSMTDKHFLGTDSAGRDVLARLVYGFRIAMLFSITLLIVEYGVGVLIGCYMGFKGGWFDLLFQRLIEIWSNIPFLYVVMIMSSIITPGFWSLVLIMALFGWMAITWYMRTATYKEASRDYVLAARMMGAGPWRIIVNHILPNAVSTIVTFIPFSVAAGITALTALDFLGFGLPAPTPSWGELLKQGVDHLESPWILLSVTTALSSVLLLVTFIGEGIREVFDPKHQTYYD